MENKILKLSSIESNIKSLTSYHKFPNSCITNLILTLMVCMVVNAGTSPEPSTSSSSRKRSAMQPTTRDRCPHATSLALKKQEPSWGLFSFLPDIKTTHALYRGSTISPPTSSPFVRNMLELGKSQSWTRALETISGDTRMNARPLMDYFQKLYDWLRADNIKHNRFVGWDTGVEPCEYEWGPH